MKMPLEYAQEITKLHKLYIQGKLDPLTVVTNHKTIRAHQRKAAVAGRVSEAVSGGEMWGLVFEETIWEQCGEAELVTPLMAGLLLHGLKRQRIPTPAHSRILSTRAGLPMEGMAR